LHFGRHTVVAHDGAAVAQAAGLALDHELPQGIAGLSDQHASALLIGLRWQCRLCGIEFTQRLQRGLERAAEAAERGRLSAMISVSIRSRAEADRSGGLRCIGSGAFRLVSIAPSRPRLQ
jgi:hypothetical protein